MKQTRCYNCKTTESDRWHEHTATVSDDHGGRPLDIEIVLCDNCEQYLDDEILLPTME